MATTTLMSFAEFERLETGADQVELLKGELLRMPPAKLRHNNSSDQLFFLLRLALEKACSRLRAHREMGYLIGTDPDSWLQPDVSVTHADQQGDDYYLGAPLIAFEMVSDSDRAGTLQEKVTEYLAQGAGEVWVIYPNQRYAWVYARGAAVARHETKSIHSDLLPGIEIASDEIFV